MQEQLVGRRIALKYMGILTATAAGREFLASWLPSASAANGFRGLVNVPGMRHGTPTAAVEDAPYSPQFFKPDELKTVELLTEMIIPTDDKPGAIEAQVARYIDFVVFSAAEFRPELQRKWAEGLEILERSSQEKFGSRFREITPEQRERLLAEMSVPEHDPHASHPGFPFYRLVKEMTVEGFYTSRVGLIDVLEYQGLAFLAEFPGCTHPEHQT